MILGVVVHTIIDFLLYDKEMAKWAERGAKEKFVRCEYSISQHTCFWLLRFASFVVVGRCDVKDEVTSTVKNI